MVAGRPREHDREKIIQDMIEWAKLPTSLNVNQFVAEYKIMITPRKLSEYAKEDDKFRESYEHVKAHLGARREVAVNTGKLHVKAYDLNATAYDFVLKEDRQETKIFDNELAKLQVQEKLSDETIALFKAYMEQMNSLSIKNSNK